MLRRGARGSWNRGHGTRAGGLKCLRARGACDLVFLRARGCRAPWAKGRSGRGDASRPFRPKGLFESKPHERQRTQRVRKAGGRGTRRGGEKPRGRSVPGVADPGDTDPFGSRRCRGDEPQEGRSDLARSETAPWPEPCEGGQACGSGRAVLGPRGRPDVGTPRGRRDDAEGAANQ